MTTSPRGADELVESQAIPEETVNEMIRHTEAGACHFPVTDRITTPPGSCSDGANYIITATATGLWTGKENQIATALGTNAANGWRYHVPVEGFTAYVQDEDQRYLFGAASWAVDTTGGSYTDEQAQDAVGAMVDGTLTYTDATPLLRVTQETKASDIASASTTNIGALAGGFAHVTGTTTITAFDSATAGLTRTLKFDGALTLTHNATSLILPTGANITTAAGDTAIFRSEGSGNWRCIAYQRASGAALVATPPAPSVQSVSSSATVTPTFSDDLVKITAQAAGLTLANWSGTSVPGWGMAIRIKDNGTARSITYGSKYRAIGVTLPTTTVISKTLYLGCIYNADDDKFDVVAVAQEA